MSDQDPKQVGPWQIDAVNFREDGRTSYRASIGELRADLTVLSQSAPNERRLDIDLGASKHVFALQIPNVLDFSASANPPWVAADPAPGLRLTEVLASADALSPRQWTELGRSALLGCAALRSARIRTFQLSPNTFTIDGDSVYMADAWTNEFHRNPYYDIASPYLSEVTPTDDKYAIGKLLMLAMGLDPSDPNPTLSSVASYGYTDKHLDYVRQMTSPRLTQRPSTEAALRSIPGGDPDVAIPLFALDRPERVLLKRKLVKAALWAGAVAAGGTALVAVFFVFLDSSEEPPTAQTQVADVSESPAGIEPRSVRITLVNKDGPEQILEESSEFKFTWCYPEANMNMDEIPDRLVFQRLDGDEWITDESIAVYMGTASKCADDEIALSSTAPLPDVNSLTTLWSDCQDFRILIPRLSSDRRAPVRFCVQQRAIT